MVDAAIVILVPVVGGVLVVALVRNKWRKRRAAEAETWKSPNVEGATYVLLRDGDGNTQDIVGVPDEGLINLTTPDADDASETHWDIDD